MFLKYPLPDKPLSLLNFDDLLIISLANGQIISLDERSVFRSVYENSGITIGCLQKFYENRSSEQQQFLVSGDWQGNVIFLERKGTKSEQKFSFSQKIALGNNLIKAMISHNDRLFISIGSKLVIIAREECGRFSVSTQFELNNKILTFFAFKQTVFMGMSVPAILAVRNRNSSDFTIFELECGQQSGIVSIFGTDELSFEENSNEKLKIKRVYLKSTGNSSNLELNENSGDLLDLPAFLFTGSNDKTIFLNSKQQRNCADICRKIDEKHFTDGDILFQMGDNARVLKANKEIQDFTPFQSGLAIACLDCTVHVQSNFDDDLEELKSLMAK